MLSEIATPKVTLLLSPPVKALTCCSISEGTPSTAFLVPDDSTFGFYFSGDPFIAAALFRSSVITEVVFRSNA